MRTPRIISTLFASALIASLATAAVAQTPAPKPAAPAAPVAPAALKAPEPPAGVTPVVAAIPFQAAAFQTEEGKRLLAELKKKYDPKQTALKALAEEIAGLDKQLADPAAKFTDAEKAERKKVIDTKRKQLQREAEAGQAESQKDFANMWKPLAEKFYKALVAEARERGVAMIVDAGSEQHPVIWAADWEKPLDISLGVIDRYNKTPAAAPTTPAVPSTGTVTK